MYEVQIPPEFYSDYFTHYHTSFPSNKFYVLVNEKIQHVKKFKLFQTVNRKEIKHDFIHEKESGYEEHYDDVGFNYDISNKSFISAYFDTEEEAFYFKLKYC